MKKIALYIRVSTDEQALKGNSLSEQEQRLRAYCHAMDWSGTIEVFNDDGYSAGNLKRPALTRMLRQVRKKEIGMVIITKIDRLCRNLKELLMLVDEFDELQCGFASASERFDTSNATGRMALHILGAFAEFERGRNSERVRENMISLVTNTDKAISRPCFGYDIVDGKLVINKNEAEIVKKMAEWMIEGEGAHKVMMRLKDMGIKTKDGNQFSQGSVRRLMHRETLTGTMIYNRTYALRGKILTRPPEEWIIIDNHHEAILDKDTFQQLQMAITSRRRAGAQADNERWLLSGLLRCAHCGGLMIGRYRRKNSGREYYNYVCNTYSKKGECYHHYIRRDEIENTVLGNLKEIGQQITGDFGEVPVTEAENQVDTSKLHEKLKKLDVKMQKQIELFEDDDISREDYRIARDRINREREEIEEQISIAETGSRASLEKDFLKRVDSLKPNLNSNNRGEIKNALRQLIKIVDITNGSDVNIQVRLEPLDY
ncbi:recombinase family protein [Paenibacillus polymyxa]|uniref:recombinase family protein n=1 Tax=Paenibacillus polymyxa TaxID=1406 RepID=UPI00083D9D8B|nr:recombinase family protein [Paenibacillus polymyxa]ODB65176.1 hypothetical protein A7309_08685 [Paenibacillus polymyxa]